MTQKPEHTPSVDGPNPHERDDAAFEAPQGNATPLPEGGTPAPKVDEVDFKDKYLRLMADMENLRKRTARDVEDARRFAVTAFARDMLDVADNLERALAAVQKDKIENEHIKNMLSGVEMVSQQLENVFKQFKIEKTNPQVGEKFNPELHQAMFEVETNTHPHGHIAQVMQAGYTIAGRLLRPAMVGTAKQAPAETDDTKQKQA